MLATSPSIHSNARATLRLMAVAALSLVAACSSGGSNNNAADASADSSDALGICPRPEPGVTTCPAGCKPYTGNVFNTAHQCIVPVTAIIGCIPTGLSCTPGAGCATDDGSGLVIRYERLCALGGFTPIAAPGCDDRTPFCSDAGDDGGSDDGSVTDDGGGDAASDAASEAASDAVSDALADAASDAATDAASEAAVDAASEAASDAADDSG